MTLAIIPAVITAVAGMTFLNGAKDLGEASRGAAWISVLFGVSSIITAVSLIMLLVSAP